MTSNPESEKVKLPNPYKAIGEELVTAIVGGERRTLGGSGTLETLAERLRAYAYYRTENMIDVDDAMLVQDLHAAATALTRPPSPEPSMTEALEFYADDNNYLIEDSEHCPISIDCGSKARAALAKEPTNG